MREDRAEIAVQPPILFLVALVGGAALHLFVPEPYVRLPPGIGLPVALALFMGAGLLAGFSIAVMRRAGTPIDPVKPTRSLVFSGPYRFTRNPMYISLILVLLSFAFLASSFWLFLMSVLLPIALHAVVVKKEEEYLLKKFGDPYRQYLRTVRRWL